MFLWKVLPEPFPAPIFIAEDEITKGKSCKNYCSVCCSGYFLAWILILIITALLATWIFVLIQVNYVMPQTLGWENLLRTFGSAIYITECANNTFTSAYSSSSMSSSISSSNLKIMGAASAHVSLSDCWTTGYTLPAVPVIAGSILLVTIVNGIWCLLPVPLLNLYNAVLGLRANLAWHLFFFLVGFPVVTIYFILDLVGLKANMQNSLGFEPGKNDTASPRWKLTQIYDHCCGVSNHSDWTTLTVNGNYPMSCCNLKDPDSTASPGCNVSNVWPNGCYNTEFNRVLYYGLLEILLIWVTYFLSLCLYKLIVSLSLRQYQEARTVGDITSKKEPGLQQDIQIPGPSTPLLTK